MAKSNKLKQEGNLFDKIFKEASDSTMIKLISERDGYKIEKIEEKKTKMQTTWEREIDSCYFITTDTSAEIILNLEYQSGNDPELIFRIFEYHAMLLRRNPGKIIKSKVIYLGREKMNMRSHLKETEIFRKFDLIDASKLCYKRLLYSENTEEIMHTILGDFPKVQAEKVIHEIIEQLRKHSKSQAELVQRCHQLQVFSFLRNLGEETNKILKNMSVHIDITKTELFKNAVRPTVVEYERMLSEERSAKKLAVEKFQQEKVSTVVKLLHIGTFTLRQIADITNTSLGFVRKIKKEF